MNSQPDLTDKDPMTFGTWKDRGAKMGEIPHKYWRWFLDQPWSSQWPREVKYAKKALNLK